MRSFPYRPRPGRGPSVFRVLRPLLTLGVLGLAVPVQGCSTTPASRTPLKEKLSGLTQHQIVETAEGCLTKAGWQVDPFPDNVGGALRMRATKSGDTTELYIEPQGMTPRINGGPDWGERGDPFWPCMNTELH